MQVAYWLLINPILVGLALGAFLFWVAFGICS